MKNINLISFIAILFLASTSFAGGPMGNLYGILSGLMAMIYRPQAPRTPQRTPEEILALREARLLAAPAPTEENRDPTVEEMEARRRAENIARLARTLREQEQEIAEAAKARRSEQEQTANAENYRAQQALVEAETRARVGTLGTNGIEEQEAAG
ncbi:MAG: hypothetical protein WCK49_05865, partial [Myxococcaceae bacterium]